MPDLDMFESLGHPLFPAMGGGEPGVSKTLGTAANEVPGGAALSEQGRWTQQYRPSPRFLSPIVSEGFPPISAKLVGKILLQEFIDMEELLQDNTAM